MKTLDYWHIRANRVFIKRIPEKEHPPRYVYFRLLTHLNGERIHEEDYRLKTSSYLGKPCQGSLVKITKKGK